MKFYFCGGLDCPDWILQEIALLSKLSSVKMKLLCKQVVSGIEVPEGTDFEKVAKLTADAKFGESEVKSSVAALRFIFTNASRFDVGPTTLAKELQQLGLPKEHSDALCRTLNDRLDNIKQALYNDSLRLPRLESVDWRVDHLLDKSVPGLASATQPLDQPSFQIRLNTTHELKGALSQPKTIEVEMDQQSLSLMLHELKVAREMMTKVE